MSDLSDQITEDMKQAMRAKDTVTLNTVRMLKAAIQNTAIEKSGANAELTDTEIVAVVRKEAKKRQDSIEQFQKANRVDLADKEQAEIEVLEKYLPRQLGEDEVVKLVEEVIAELDATSKKEMGQVMKVLQERAAGRADGKLLSQTVMARLA